MTVQHIQGVLESFEDSTPSVRRLFIRVSGVSRFDFQPGQHVTLKIPVSGGSITRPYSIASAPGASNLIELCIKHVDGGTATDYLHSIQKGTRLEMTGPSGSFLLRQPVRGNCLFVAAGTGIAPIRSMLLQLMRQGTTHQVTLVFGVRYERDILYREEFEKLQGLNTNFRFVPALSRAGNDWTGARGHVQEAIRRLVDAYSGGEAYLCGMEAMVREVRSILREGGFTDSNIHLEDYVR